MKCINPLKASQDHEGNIIYNSKKAIPGLIGFEFECRKCLPCRLNQAREKAVRATHEAKMYEDNMFLTLTYDEENLKSKKLQYIDFQLFMKSLREFRVRGITDPKIKKNLKISYMVTGEYGEINKRPHWHALIFNYRPPDAEYKYSTDHGEKVYTSKIIDKLWKKGSSEFGSLTMDSANYVCRYSAKKLVHGKDEDHDYHPIHKTSSKHGIGKPWIEKYWQHTFENGFVVLPNGQITKIPRYYVDWFKKNKPEEYTRYATGIKEEIGKKADLKARKEEAEYLSQLFTRLGRDKKGGTIPRLKTRSEVKLNCLKRKFKQLEENLKL
jgi:hypothetical protein